MLYYLINPSRPTWLKHHHLNFFVYFVSKFTATFEEYYWQKNSLTQKMG